MCRNTSVLTIALIHADGDCQQITPPRKSRIIGKLTRQNNPRVRALFVQFTHNATAIGVVGQKRTHQLNSILVDFLDVRF